MLVSKHHICIISTSKHCIKIALQISHATSILKHCMQRHAQKIIAMSISKHFNKTTLKTSHATLIKKIV
jgi:hypothetical protein